MTASLIPPHRRRRPFYGWWIVLGAVVGQFAAMGVAGQISGVFLRPMTDDLGWAAADYTLGTSAAFVAGGIAGFFVGPFVDRYGARPLMLIGGVMYGLALVGISRVNEVWQFIALQTLAGGLGPDIRPAALAALDRTALVSVILDGRPGTAMPPWRPLLSEAEAAWIAEYLRTGDAP